MEKTPWHILLVDDDEEDYLILRAMFYGARGQKVNLEWASTYGTGLAVIQSKPFDAVLVDYELKGYSGIELIQQLAAAGYPAPLILYTGRGNYEVDQEAQHAGATFYLTKSEVTPLILERNIRYAIERKQIEAQLRASQAIAMGERNQLAAVMESLPVGVALVDSEGEITRINEGFNNIWGAGPAIKNFAGCRAWWVDGGKPVEAHEWAPARAIACGETVAGQFLQIERADGKHAYILNSAAPIFDAEGKITGSSMASIDITHVIEVERALRESQSNYHKYFTLLFEGFALHELIYDVNGFPVDYRFLEVNPAFEGLTGLSAEQILGMTVMELFPNTEPYWIETFAEVARSGNPLRVEGYHQALGKYFEGIAFKPAPKQFGLIFTTVSKKTR